MYILPGPQWSPMTEVSSCASLMSMSFWFCTECKELPLGNIKASQIWVDTIIKGKAAYPDSGVKQPTTDMYRLFNPQRYIHYYEQVTHASQIC